MVIEVDERSRLQRDGHAAPTSDSGKVAKDQVVSVGDAAAAHGNTSKGVSDFVEENAALAERALGAVNTCGRQRYAEAQADEAVPFSVRQTSISGGGDGGQANAGFAVAGKRREAKAVDD